jgi:hypothetical protein
MTRQIVVERTGTSFRGSVINDLSVVSCILKEGRAARATSLGTLEFSKRS